MTEKIFLLVDAGNTRIKMRVYSRGTTISEAGYYHDEERKILEWIDSQTFNEVLICNTGFPDTAFEKWFGHRPLHFMNHLQPAGLAWAYHQPEQIGKDRIASMLGARKLYPGKAICVAGAGTCLTIDFISESGNHVGGSISPGLQMRLKAMHTFTEKLPQSSVSELIDYWGKSSLSCLASGALWGMVAEIEHRFAAAKTIEPTETVLVLTGGDADFLAQRLKVHNFVVSDLVFQGMFAVLASLVK